MKRFRARLELKNQIERNGVGDGDGVRRGGEVMHRASGGCRACSYSSVGTSEGGDARVGEVSDAFHSRSLLPRNRGKGREVVGPVEQSSITHFIGSRRKWNPGWGSAGIGCIELPSIPHFIGSQMEMKSAIGERGRAAFGFSFQRIFD